MKDFGIILAVVGVVLLLAGITLISLSRFSWPGHLPGDIHWNGKHGSFSFPLTTCILVSIILTVALNLILRLFHR